ncbi:hypothetical protein HLV39_02985 [Marinobacter adhaerens]|uniref:DUF6160 domain-containing protein n=1 Tax=Marinobacter adhaerens TaxID=1033846 RepID=A0A851HLN0_9GAMM|nr:DUF6160 family protein [Marinobacter adhaerens]NWN90464.1 hypothetical protein [Marinobacter adhaerens]
MKGLKKIALVTAIAAAPFAAQADMKALDDTAMGNVTGQSGVTIELETQVEVGKFTYTDEGSFSVSGIKLGGSSVATGDTGNELLDELKIDIDINEAGDAVIHVGSMSTQDLSAIGQGVDEPAPIDWGITANSMELSGTGGSTTLLSGLKGHGNLSKLDINVRNGNQTRHEQTALNDNGYLELDVGFNVVDMQFDADFLGVGVSGMSILGANSDAIKQQYMGAGMTEAEAEGMLATTSFAKAELDVYKGDGVGSSTEKDVLRIDVSNVAMDINIDDVVVGGTIANDIGSRSIGSVGITNLQINDTKLAVYGH